MGVGMGDGQNLKKKGGVSNTGGPVLIMLFSPTLHFGSLLGLST